MTAPSNTRRNGSDRRAQAPDLQLVVDSTPGLIHAGRPDGYLDFFNQAWLCYLGRSLEDLQGWKWTAVIHPDEVEGIVQKWRASLASGEPFLYEARVLRADGEYRWMLHHKVALRNQQGEIVKWYGSSIDIQARKCAEFYLREAQRLTHMASWAWEVAGRDALHLSDEWYRIYGFDPKQGRPTWEDWLQRVHPEDRDKRQRTIEQAIREKSDYDVEHRILLSDGTVKWVHTVAHPVLGARGQLVQFVGSSMDITERKEAEDKIREQETELRQMLDLTPQHVHVLAADATLVYTNEVALKYHGLTLDEWKERPITEWRADEVPFKIFHPDDRERLIGELKNKLLCGSPHETEARLLRYDGKYRWFLFRFNPLRDRQGCVMRWYVAGTDIEDRKQAEEKLQQENAALREEIDEASMFEEIVGTSPVVGNVLSCISKVAPTESTVLITGETGTGKELVARAIHRRSRRTSRAFVSVNCAAIPRDLILPELFGHEKGAFTGAIHRRLGRFELADGGTIFLDEVGELLPETQIALLRVLQEREFERVGGGQPIHVDVRVIAATNRDLHAAVANGTFREDLFYRLNVFPIEVPPLRERKDDILMLVEYFVQRYATRAGKNIRSIDKKTLDLLQSYDWPGNIRELQNVIERSVILSSREALSVDEMWLPKETSRPASRVEASPRLNGGAEPPSEREIIEAALAETRGRLSGPSGAATKLRIPPSTLANRIKALKINKKQFKFG